MNINELCDIVRETSFAIHKYHRNGHLEKIYDIEDCLIVELKACRHTTDEHISQLLGYLTSARIHDGLLINFGSEKLYVKKYVMG